MTFLPLTLSNVDPLNSTTTPPGSGPPFTFLGTPQKTIGYNTIALTVQCDQSSSPQGFSIEFSTDGISFPTVLRQTYFASTRFEQTVPITSTYYRLRFSVNTTPSVFIVQSRLLTGYGSASTAPGNPLGNNVADLIYTASPSSFYDSFGRLRMVSPFTLFDLKYPPNTTGTGTTSYRENNLSIGYLSTTVGGATITTSFERGRGIFTISGQGSFISQSRRYAVYQPGKSLLILCSGILNNGGLNNAPCTTNIGYFDANNGLFFQYTNGSTLNIVLRNQAVDTIIPQSQWNIDTMDGNGPSSLFLNISNAQLFAFDLEWLGVGQLRFGFFAYGRLFYCHQITNINSLTNPYCVTASLPVRFEIISSSNTGSGSIMQICSTVNSEGGYNPPGKPFSVSTPPGAGVAVTTTEVPLIAITGISSYNHETVIPTTVSLMDTDNNNGYLYRIRYYPSPADSDNPIQTSTNVDVNSVVAYAVTADIKTPFASYTSASVIVDEGLFYGRGLVQLASLSDVFNSLCQMTKAINGKTDVILLTAQKTGNTGTGTLFATMTWQEIY